MTDEQTAAAIVANFVQVDYSSTNVLSGYAARTPLRDSAAKALDDKAMMVDAIVRALQAARKECMDADDVDLVAPTPEVVATLRTKAPPGHIIDDAGVVRKVLGTLFYTDDGCVVADGGRVYFVNSNDNICEWDASGTGNHVPVHMCYSTREAAEAAKEGKA